MSDFSGHPCSGCGLQESCQAGVGSSGPFKGLSLVVAAAGYFLFPLATALLGALVIGAAPLQQLAGAGGGLGIGMLITVRVVRTLCIGSQKGSSA